MRYRNLGKTDIKASVVALGTWATGGDSAWGASDDAESVRTIERALELGVNLVDTAPAYGLGHSEEIVGKAIRGKRDRYVVQTKCGLTWENPVGTVHMERDGVTIRRNLSPSSIRADLEASLRRLETDYIDVFITHWQSVEPYFIPVEETMGELNRFIEEGKVRAIGISNVDANHIREYAKAGNIALIQEKYSMLDRRIEKTLMPVCEELGITVQAYSPLERGILTGTVKLNTGIVGFAKEKTKWYEPEYRQMIIDMFNNLAPLCKKYGCSPANLIIAWTVARTESMNILCGGRRVEQIEDNAKGGDIVMDSSDLAFMEEEAAKLTGK